MSRVPFRASLALALAVGAAACGAPPASPTPSPVASPSPVATPSPAPTPAGVIVTFRVVEETYKVLVTDPAQVEHVYGLLEGGDEGTIPNGLIVRGDPGVNAPWSWHIDPASLDFADMTIELCDGIPSFVEDGTLEGDRFCPWAAQVIDVQPAH